MARNYKKAFNNHASSAKNLANQCNSPWSVIMFYDNISHGNDSYRRHLSLIHRKEFRTVEDRDARDDDLV